MLRGLATAMIFAMGFVVSTGCTSNEPKNLMDGVDQAALEEYEAMIAADEAAMSNAGDADTGE